MTSPSQSFDQQNSPLSRGALKNLISPSATTVLIAMNVVLFVAMVCCTSYKSLLIPSSQVLLNWGASSGSETLTALQFWRLLTCAFVHVGILHLGMNMFVLRDVGGQVEKIYGPNNFLLVYAFSSIGGGLTSIFLNPLVVSAGASGAIFGTFGALLAVVWRRPELFPKGYLLLHGKIVLFLVCYGFAFSLIDKSMDNAAHFGGFAAGFLAGLCVLPQMPGALTSFQYRSVAALAIVVCGLGATAYHVFSNNPEVVAESHYRHAIALLEEKKFADALPLLNKTLAITPKNGAAICDRARAYIELKQFAPAMEDCTEAVRVDPTNKTAYLVKASVCQKTKNYRQAIDDLTKVVELDPKNFLAYNNRAWSEAALGQLDQSLKDCNASIDMKNDVATTYDTRAIVYILLKRFPDAEADLDKAIALDSKEGAYYFHRAIVRQRVGKAGPESDLAKSRTLSYVPEDWEPAVGL